MVSKQNVLDLNSIFSLLKKKKIEKFETLNNTYLEGV